MTVTLGTVASENANSSLAPCLMRPPYSCAVPGRKPGTSTKVMIGTSKQSQKRTKRAALREASESSTPASTIGIVEEVALVDHLQDQLLDVVGLVGVVGDQGVERGLG